MKKLINIRKLIFSLLVVFLFVSCDDYLDIVPDSIATIEDNAFSMRVQTEKFLFTCYSYLPAHGSVNGNPALLGGDEIWATKDYQSDFGIQSWQIARGNQRSDNPYCDFWTGGYGGKDLYQGISDCNIFLENIGRVPDMNSAERNRWIAEVEFLKAYFHFWLVRMYGPIPVKDKNLSVNAGMEQVKVYRNTLDECFDYIVNKLDSVIALNHLPDKIENEAEELGRITQGIALAVKAQVLVTAASPLFNGNTDYKGLADGRGIEIFSPDKTDEQKKQRWEEATKACREAIDFLASQGQSGLFRYTSSEYSISPETRAKLSFRLAVTEKWNKEIVWGNSNSWVGKTGADLQTQALPRDLESAKALSNTTNRNNHAVPLKIASQFYTRNGVPIVEDKTWDYAGRFNLRTATADEKYLIKEGYTTAEFNFDREIRYYASLGFDGGIWYGQGVTDNNAPLYVQAKVGQIAANQTPPMTNETGIWPKKLVHFKTVVGASSGITYITYPFPVIRLSDLYLMYAEALNESGAPYSEVIPWIDLVRDRAELPGVEESWTNFSTNPDKFKSQRGLREIIRQERSIELAFEGHRFWDLRRWKTAMSEYAQPITGWNIIYAEARDYYNERFLFSLNFSPRDYFWPVPDGEILRNSNTLQNFGW
ncbi:MAG: RagB/SusD family nutrient uptake outer membrane protein [Mangrovibacterium sp.]